MTGVAHREAGRALVVDPRGRALMIRGIDPYDPVGRGFWFTPGGGLDAGESAAAGTVREVHEELGLHIDAVGPVVMLRRSRFTFAGKQFLQAEVIHLVEVADAFAPRPVALDRIEQQMIREFRWLSADDVRALDEDSYPLALAALIDHVVAFGPPDPPWVEDITDEA